MKWLVGLGNPGAKYELTRHNVGFMLADNLALAHGLSWKEKRFQAEIARGQISGQEALLARPLTFMNLTGRAVAKLAAHFNLPVSDLIVIHDDIDLPLGKIRIRKGGGDAGHQGVRSIIEYLGDPEFLRLRLGVGRPPPGQDPADYVLSLFTDDEMDELNRMVALAQEAVVCLLEEGETKAMNWYNP